jgi:hypothetical protein
MHVHAGFCSHPNRNVTAVSGSIPQGWPNADKITTEAAKAETFALSLLALSTFL